MPKLPLGTGGKHPGKASSQAVGENARPLDLKGASAGTSVNAPNNVRPGAGGLGSGQMFEYGSKGKASDSN